MILMGNSGSLSPQWFHSLCPREASHIAKDIKQQRYCIFQAKKGPLVGGGSAGKFRWISEGERSTPARPPPSTPFPLRVAGEGEHSGLPFRHFYFSFLLSFSRCFHLFLFETGSHCLALAGLELTV